MSRTNRLTEFKVCEYYPQHVKHVQGHKVKHWNRSNSAAHCSISLQFGIWFYHITGDILQMFEVKDQRL